jgi:hypothetical protein
VTVVHFVSGPGIPYERLTFRPVQISLSKSLGLSPLSMKPLPFPFVIPSEPDFLPRPAHRDHLCGSLRENHIQLIEAAALDRKSGEGEGSAVRHSCAPPLPCHNRRQSSPNPRGNTNLPSLTPGSGAVRGTTDPSASLGMTKRRGSLLGMGDRWMRRRLLN